MRSFSKLLRGIALVGQLGVSIITPPVVLVLLAQWLMEKHGWGLWVMVAAIIIGLLTAFSGAWRTLKKLLPRNETNKTVFNQHY